MDPGNVSRQQKRLTADASSEHCYICIMTMPVAHKTFSAGSSLHFSKRDVTKDLASSEMSRHAAPDILGLSAKMERLRMYKGQGRWSDSASEGHQHRAAWCLCVILRTPQANCARVPHILTSGQLAYSSRIRRDQTVL